MSSDGDSSKNSSGNVATSFANLSPAEEILDAFVDPAGLDGKTVAVNLCDIIQDDVVTSDPTEFHQIVTSDLMSFSGYRAWAGD